MTDPTPTRAEVEAAVEKLANSHLGMSLVEWNAVSNTILTCAAENQALRERAEAAERDRSRLIIANGQLIDDAVSMGMARDAAWNDAIKAAAKVADGVSKEATKYTMPVMAMGAQKCRDDILALRRSTLAMTQKECS